MSPTPLPTIQISFIVSSLKEHYVSELEYPESIDNVRPCFTEITPEMEKDNIDFVELAQSFIRDCILNPITPEVQEQRLQKLDKEIEKLLQENGENDFDPFL